jgi:hypothetical protein
MRLSRNAVLALVLACGTIAGVSGCASGNPGTQGAAGSSGVGAAGNTGTTGTTGTGGTTATAGTSGVTGAAGQSGSSAAGTAGAGAGTAGGVGTAGAGGPAGSTGSGTAGIGGTAGATGVAGQTAAGSAGVSGGAGTSGASGPDPGVYTAKQAAKSNRYLPLSVGARWGWRVSDAASGATGMTQSWVEALETLTGTKNGISAYRVRSTTLTGGTLNWQQDTGTTVVRHREQFSDLTGALKSSFEMAPSQVRLDEAPAHLIAGATWKENITLTRTLPGAAPVTAAVVVTWTVDAVAESVTVPAGTFSCLRVHRVEPPSAADPTGGDNVFWFARGVGKVKETGPELHELLGYRIP